MSGRPLFYLGTHKPAWLGRMSVPLFVSRRTLAEYRRLPRALGRWALDSGGFTELSQYGQWTVSAGQYIDEARRYRDEIGGLDWAAPQDWMCEPWICGKTGLSVREHQARTIASVLELRSRAPDVPWVPVLQGWAISDYWRHVADYERAGIALRDEPTIGVGSVCRRQAMGEALTLLEGLASAGLRLHGFGFKVGGFAAGAGAHLVSADSLAWSYQARRQPIRLDGCQHKTCANCARWALIWREHVIDLIDRRGRQPVQRDLFPLLDRCTRGAT